MQAQKLPSRGLNDQNADNDFKVAVINIFKELKGTMHKE